MGVIKDSFTFDDVTLVPQYSSVLPSETITVTKLSKNLNLKIPLMSSAMDTVTESKMAIAISKSGGIGVMGDSRTYEYTCLLRAVTSEDGMTADFFSFNKNFVQEVSNKIINSVSGINRVVYDITSKPPSTIELE